MKFVAEDFLVVLIESEGGGGIGQVGGFGQEGVVAAVGIHVGFRTPERARGFEADLYRTAACLRVARKAVVVTEIHVAGHESADGASFGIELDGKCFSACVDGTSPYGGKLPDLVFVEVGYGVRRRIG